MSDLILEPTSTAQWQTMIHQAEQACAIKLGEEVESYLVFLLMRFMQRPEMAASVMAMEFLASQQASGQHRLDRLRDVGDQCLLLSGLFPGRAKQRRVRISYFVELGQGAYHQLAELSQHQLADLYSHLRLKFVPMMDVLHNLRDKTLGENQMDAVTALELWSDTDSQSALQTVRTTSQAIPVKNTSRH